MRHEAKSEAKCSSKMTASASVVDTLSRRLLFCVIGTMCFALMFILVYAFGDLSEKYNELLKIIIGGVLAVAASLVTSILVRRAKRYPIK